MHPRVLWETSLGLEESLLGLGVRLPLRVPPVWQTDSDRLSSDLGSLPARVRRRLRESVNEILLSGGYRETQQDSITVVIARHCAHL